MWSFLSVQVLYHFIIYVLPLEIQLSRGEGWNPINWFNPTTYVCLSQAGTWISNVICRGLFLCSLISVKMRGDFLFCYWWNWWPSLIKFSFHHNIIISTPVKKRYQNVWTTFISVTKLKVISLWIYNLYI